MYGNGKGRRANTMWWLIANVTSFGRRLTPWALSVVVVVQPDEGGGTVARPAAQAFQKKKDWWKGRKLRGEWAWPIYRGSLRWGKPLVRWVKFKWAPHNAQSAWKGDKRAMGGNGTATGTQAAGCGGGYAGQKPLPVPEEEEEEG